MRTCHLLVDVTHGRARSPAKQGSTALSIVVAGSSIALIVGTLGRAIEARQPGWRITFLIIAAIAFGVLGLLAAVLKKPLGQ